MSNGSGVSRGDRNRNARLARLREAVPVVNAVVGIDLADRKQMVVVCDHDSKVLVRHTFRCKAWDLGAALEWAADRAAREGFAGVMACEPTGHRWRVLSQLAADRGMSFVCVQPAASAYARRTEDLTSDKTDDKDAVLIARLTAQLRCYLPESVHPTWGRLRHLGGPGGSSCWRRTPDVCSRSGTYSSACGPLCWTRPRSRSSRPRGSQLWLWSWPATTATWPAPTGSGWTGSPG